jgi:phosphomannomutase
MKPRRKRPDPGSGTEPVLRIYAEARSDALARKLITDGVKLTGRV